MRLRRWLPAVLFLVGFRLGAAEPVITVDSHARVKTWIRALTEADAGYPRLLQRAYPYRAMVERELVARGLPRQLFYLGVIESGFLPHAKSPCGALGIWQFTLTTGTLYGLKADRRRDERRDPCRSTRAAARYLRDLHDRFGSWHLVLAAYNAGQFAVERAIKRGGTTDFWTLARRRLLPAETVSFVPKFLAAVAVGENPGRYGMELDIDEDVSPIRCRMPSL